MADVIGQLITSALLAFLKAFESAIITGGDSDAREMGRLRRL